MRRPCAWRVSLLAADDADRVALRDHLALAVREAGAVALRTFRRQPANWIKGASAPVSDELFLSVAGEGATLNGAPIAASAGHHMAGATFSGAKRRLDSLAAIEPRIA